MTILLHYWIILDNQNLDWDFQLKKLVLLKIMLVAILFL